MKRLLIVAMALALSACNVAAINSAGTIAAGAADAVGVPPPSTIADKTRLDEGVLTGAEAMYKGARLLVEPLVDIGVIRGSLAATFRKLNREAFDAVGAVRVAYDTGNAKSYAAAAEKASAAIGKLIALAK